jgi:hypothetical protein
MNSFEMYCVVECSADFNQVLSKGGRATKSGKKNGSRFVYLSVFNFRTCFQFESSFTKGSLKSSISGMQYPANIERKMTLSRSLQAGN